MLKKFKKNILAIAIIVSFAGVLSSCYYDYGIDSENSNIVVTGYDNTYPFNTINRYILDTTVNKIGDQSITNAFNSTIINTTRANLNKLGWTEASLSDSLANDVVRVSTGITTTTYTVNYNDYYWYGGGYYWGYPPYYGGYSYSYTTGTVIIAMADQKNKNGDQLPLIWSGILNGTVGQPNPSGLITEGINQAFSNAQSPYLYQ